MHWHRRPLPKYNSRTDTESKNQKVGRPEPEKPYKAKDMVDKIKQQHTEWEKIFTKSTSDTGLISKKIKISKYKMIQLKSGVESKTENSRQKNLRWSKDI